MNDEILTAAADTARTFEHKASACQSENKYAEAVDFYQQAITSYETLKDNASLARVFQKLGEVYNSWKITEPSTDWNRIALLVHESLEKQSELACLEVSKSARKLGKDLALMFMQKSIILSGRLGSSSYRSSTYLSAGDACYILGEYVRSLDWYEKALSNHTVSEDEPSVVRLHVRIARVYERMQDYDLALDACREARTRAEQLQDSSLFALIQNQFGLIYLGQESFSKALTHFERARSIYEKADDLDGIGVSYHHLGLMHFDQGDYERALDFFDKALSAARTLDRAPDLIASTCNCVALVHFHEGDYDQATAFARECVSLSERNERLHYRCFASALLGEIHRKRLDSKEALRWYRQAHSLQYALDMKASLALTSTQIGEIYGSAEFLD